MRKAREELDHLPRRRLAHLAAIVADKLSPSRLGPRLRHRAGTDGLTRREERQPEVVIVEPGEVGLLHPARRAPHRAQAQAFAGRARRSEPDEAQGPRRWWGSTMFSR